MDTDADHGCHERIMLVRGADMGMHGGAIAGDGKVFLWYEAAFHGRQDSDMIEELGISFPTGSCFSIASVSLGIVSWAFCFFSLGLTGLLLFREAGRSLFCAYKSGTR